MSSDRGSPSAEEASVRSFARLRSRNAKIEKDPSPEYWTSPVAPCNERGEQENATEEREQNKVTLCIEDTEKDRLPLNGTANFGQESTRYGAVLMGRDSTGTNGENDPDKNASDEDDSRPRKRKMKGLSSSPQETEEVIALRRAEINPRSEIPLGTTRAIEERPVRKSVRTRAAHRVTATDGQNEGASVVLRRSARIKRTKSARNSTDAIGSIRKISGSSRHHFNESQNPSRADINLTERCDGNQSRRGRKDSRREAADASSMDVESFASEPPKRADGNGDKVLGAITRRTKGNLSCKPPENCRDTNLPESSMRLNVSPGEMASSVTGNNANGNADCQEEVFTSPNPTTEPTPEQNVQMESGQHSQRRSGDRCSESVPNVEEDYIDPNNTVRGRLVTVEEVSGSQGGAESEDTEVTRDSARTSGSSEHAGRCSSVLTTRKFKRKYSFINRKQREPREEDKYRKRRLMQLQQKDDSTVRSWPCCQKMKCFENVNVDFFRFHRKRLMTSSQMHRKLALADMLESDGKFYFDKRPVCTFFLMTGFGFSKDLQRSVKGTPQAPSTISTHRTNGSDTRDDQRRVIISFLRDFADATADKMPDTDEQHLPLTRKIQVYNELVKDFRTNIVDDHDKAIPSYSYFVAVWNNSLPKIKARKVPRFTKCTECEMIRDALAKAWKDSKMSSELLQRRRNHLAFITSERASYTSRVNLASRKPDEFCSIVVDGADQRSFGLPHFTSTTKDTKGEAIKVKLVGILEHAPIPILTLYTLTGEFETGANHIIEAIHRWMNQRIQVLPLPPKLFVQADNCSRENKNRYLFGYFESLVVWGIFEEVQVSFLPIGHTHSDIDQKFSCTSSWLRNNNAVTLKDLHAELRKAYNPPPFVHAMNHVANISGLMDKEKVFRALPTFLEFFYFRFMRNGSDNNGVNQYLVQCSVKRTSQDDWQPLIARGERSCFLKATPDLRNTPDTLLSCPDNYTEVDKRISSEEARINDALKIEELRKLRDCIYKRREEHFHWDLETCLEGKGMLGLSEIETTGGRPAVFDYLTCIPRTRLEYDLFSFVIVRPEYPTKDCPFWVGRIEGLLRNIHGDVSGLRVWWYEVGDGECVLKGHYTPSNHVITKKRHLPWITDVPSDSVLLNFKRLNKDKTLGSDISKRVAVAVKALDIDLTHPSS